jgi:hypothetical protein
MSKPKICFEQVPLEVVKKILDYANNPHVYVIWNCSPIGNALASSSWP